MHSQPFSAEAELQALRAAASCPTSSIRSSVPNKSASSATRSFPIPAPGPTSGSVVDDVFFNGSASEASVGCASWLVLHRGESPMAIMIDVPRFSKPLLESIERLAEPVGGVKYLFLSHRDDVANHDKWAEALPGAKRVIHASEVNRRQGTDACEVQLTDDQFPYKLTDGCEILHVPGHTYGSIAFLHLPSASLFTGDHLFFSARQGVVAGSSSFCRYSWEEQIKSVEILADVSFLHGFPGHGRHFHFDDAKDRIRQIGKAADFMRGGPTQWAMMVQ